MKTEPKWQNTNLGRERREFLNKRIREVRLICRFNKDPLPDPPSVASARAVIERYESARQKVIQDSEKERMKLCDDAERTVLFTDDPNEAKVAVDKLLAIARKRHWIG